MSIGLDPNASAVGFFQQSTGTTATITISTTNSGDLIVVDFTDSTSFTTAAPTSTHLTFTKHAQNNLVSSSICRYYAVASSPLTNEVITIGTLANGFTRGTAYAASGANTSAPFDSGGPQISTTDPISITTVNANTMIVGYFTCNTPTNPGTGFTTIHTASGDFAIDEYQVVSSAGTYSVTLGSGGSGTASGVIADAIVAASGGGVGVGTLSMMGAGHHKHIGWTPLMDRRAKVRYHRRLWRLDQ